jgi:hypothetical protein
MCRRAGNLGAVCAAVTVIAVGCSRQPPPDLATALKGIDKTKFLSCSGPPLLDYPTSGQERMSFVTDLRRGAAIGVASPGALSPESCNVDTLFQDERLVSANFSGNISLCNMVFAPCLQH